MRLKILMIFCLSIICYSQADEPCFFWDFSSNTPNIFKTDGTPGFYANSGISNGSFRNEDDWALATFDNPTLKDEWCPTSEGSIEIYWQYSAPWSGKMLFQITGKDMSKKEDTNDNWGLVMVGNRPGVFNCTMGWIGPGSYETAVAHNRSKPITLVEGKWYRFRLKYKLGVGISMQIDDSETFTINNPLGKPSCTAWHHLLIGNDTHATGVQRIDNFSIWPTWLESFPESNNRTSIGTNFKESSSQKRIAITNNSSKGVYSLNGRFIGQGVKTKATILQVEMFQNIPARKVFSK